jgi:hypothetical protein
MHTDNAVVDLAATTQPLSRRPGSMFAALGRCGFVNAADSLVVGVLASDQPLTVIAHTQFIPLDRFHKTL